MVNSVTENNVDARLLTRGIVDAPRHDGSIPEPETWREPTGSWGYAPIFIAHFEQQSRGRDASFDRFVEAEGKGQADSQGDEELT
jgi:hypothetical protein